MSLEKVINSILQDKVTAEDCRKALQEAKAMAQAVSDNQKVVEKLQSEQDSLRSENARLKAKLDEAEKAIADKQAQADAEIANKLANADKAAAELVSKAKAEFDALNARIVAGKCDADNAEKAAVDAKAKLAEVEKALDQAKGKLRAFVE